MDRAAALGQAAGSFFFSMVVFFSFCLFHFLPITTTGLFFLGLLQGKSKFLVVSDILYRFLVVFAIYEMFFVDLCGSLHISTQWYYRFKFRTVRMFNEH